MADHVVATSDELFELSLARTLKTIGNAYFGLTEYDENDDTDNVFDFKIDRSLLIDPRGIVYGAEIGEGHHSIVYEGVWVFSICQL